MSWAPCLAAAPPASFNKYCVSCHGKAATAGVDLQKMMAQASIADSFVQWEKVAAALEERRMPPAQLPQPSDAERNEAIAWVNTELKTYAAKHGGDPGRVTVRRLTAGEYAYTVQDLTGVDMELGLDASGDAVGGEGFTNYGDVQFMQDASLERYLTAAKRIADHAVIGSGPLQFYKDPGKSGLEMSAIHRIRDIYETQGFRATAAEGGLPYGLDRYGKAFYVAWYFKNRAALGEPKATIEQLAKREGVTTEFAQHISSTVNGPYKSYPLRDIIARWRAIPAPGADREASKVAARAASTEVQKAAINWPRWMFAAGDLAQGGRGDERALVLTETSITAAPSNKFTFLYRSRRGQPAVVHLTALPANPDAKEQPVIIWRNPMVRVRGRDRAAGTSTPLSEMVTPEDRAKLAFGKHPAGIPIGPNDFVTTGETTLTFGVKVPDGIFGFGMSLEAQLDPAQAGAAVMRCTLADSEDLSKTLGTPASALLANTENPGYKAWKAGVLEFAANLPQVSQFEPTPADRDDIPPPFDNTYNQPERDHFHQRVKYHRDDAFLMSKMIDPPTRRRLDVAWTDLLTSFEYHDTYLRFAAKKFGGDLKGKTIGELTSADIAAQPAEVQKWARQLRSDFDAKWAARRAAESGHIDDVLKLAARAWRRPLTAAESRELRAFYGTARKDLELDHDKAIRAMIARVMVAPDFLYRFEQPRQVSGVSPLTDAELASRLSYFLWSSMPDQELLRAASARELTDPKKLDAQVRRMLADPKARRFSEEFFGQWLGFYRFDEYRGVDTGRFPEFTPEIRKSMYDEAVSFFEYVVRSDRPVNELVAADYAFLNEPLAKFYGIDKKVDSKEAMVKVDGAGQFQRGGLLRLGAVLTATSAPLRTSPVKRGDWVLRRVIGTPVPPPPANPGTIPADPKQFGDQTLAQRLKEHQRNATCRSCHARIDPLGFPLETYDAVGRVREKYEDGKPIDATSTLYDQTRIDGLKGLMSYIERQEPRVLRTFAQKLTGYALGRTIQASDLPLIESMVQSGSNAPFSEFALKLIRSPQFRMVRGREESTETTSGAAGGGK